MIRHRGCLYSYLISSMCFLITAPGFGALGTGSLFSQTTAELFVQQAKMLHARSVSDPQAIEQAMTFLDAALALNESSGEAPEQMLRIGASGLYTEADYSKKIDWALQRQVGPRADLTVLNGAVRYLLAQQNSRLDREVLLLLLQKQYALKNEFFGSDLAAQLALLAVEKADMQTATDQLSYAYQLNPYNQLAYTKLQEITQAQGLELTPSAYLAGLRTSLDLNPYKLPVAIEYAETLKRMRLYEIAAVAYEYAAQIHEYLAPDQSLDQAIYWSWLLCGYRAPRQETAMLEVVQRYRDKGQFDLLAEAVAGKIQIKLGQTADGRETLNLAAKKAERLLANSDSDNPIFPEQLAWFYCFVLDQPETALAWANRAYKQDPDRQGVKEMFAYTLALSGQPEVAKQYASASEKTSQTAALALGLVAIAEEDKTAAIGLLRSAIDMSPESFAAEKAMQMLKEQGSDYIQPSPAETVRQDLTAAFGNRMAPQFATPMRRMNAKLDFGGTEFSYGISLAPKLVIENTSSAPLVIGPGGLFHGHVQVDAKLSGNLNVEIPNAFSTVFRPSRPIEPGEHVSVPLPIETGKLGRILLTYPQADVEVNLTVYLDPVVDQDGRISNTLNEIEPVNASVKRSGVALTRDFFMQRMDALSKGRPGQQFRAVRLFVGLLAEQKAFEASGADFRYVQVDQVLLTDSVRKALKDENWKLRVEALDALLTLSVPLDTALMTEISGNLNHEKWPVRLAAMVLLAKAQPQTFQTVLDWTARQDPHWVNRRMALGLGAKLPEKAKKDAIMP